MTCTHAGQSYGEGSRVCMPDGKIYVCRGTEWQPTDRRCVPRPDGTFEDLGPADAEFKVDDKVVPLGAFNVRLASGKDVMVSGPAALEVHDGSLLLVNSQGKASVAWAAGQWISVNGGA